MTATAVDDRVRNQTERRSSSHSAREASVHGATPAAPGPFSARR